MLVLVVLGLEILELVVLGLVIIGLNSRIGVTMGRYEVTRLEVGGVKMGRLKIDRLEMGTKVGR
jgi:hypothetical protein